MLLSLVQDHVQTLKFNFELIDLHQFFLLAEKMVKQKHQDINIKIESKLLAHECSNVHIDQERILQILMVFVDNAVETTLAKLNTEEKKNDKPIIICYELTNIKGRYSVATSEKNQRFLKISVKDQGLGMK